MTKEQSKAYSTALNEVWQVYKARYTEEEQSEEWWSDTMLVFTDVVEKQTDDKIKNFVSKFAIACMKDIQDKSLNRDRAEPLNFSNKDMTVEEFSEYLKKPKAGDMFKVNGQMIKIVDWRK